jgi:hypothetical protein
MQLQKIRWFCGGGRLRRKGQLSHAQEVRRRDAVCLTIRTLGIQESLLEGPEDEQADQYNNAENQCKDRYLLDS